MSRETSCSCRTALVRLKIVPLDKYKDREVFSTQELELRVGDRLRFTRNHREWGQINGQLLTIDAFNSDGTISINTRGKIETLTLTSWCMWIMPIVGRSMRLRDGQPKKRSGHRVAIQGKSRPMWRFLGLRRN